jgi:AcrR family transcriptional regulator
VKATASSWRQRQRTTTRAHIIAAAQGLLLDAPTEAFSHERIAQAAGLGARTVYRHFPTRANLMQALWERVRDETRTRFPSTEEDVVTFARAQFNEFNEREALVRASNAFPAAGELRARGSLEGRPAFRRSLAGITKNLSDWEQRRLIAVCLAIYSAPFWLLLRDRGELTEQEPGEAAAWARSVLLTAAKTGTRAKSRVRKEPANGHRRTRRTKR